MEGKVLSINISEHKGTPKTKITPGVLIENFGFEGDAHAGEWHRQVSLLALESIEKVTDSENVNGIFAENITTKGITLHILPVGTRLQVGECVLEVTQIGKECHNGCAIKETVGKCIMPLEGIFAKVIKGGKVYENDSVRVIENEG